MPGDAEYGDKRDGKRIPVTLPVMLPEGAGNTRDVSVSGVYFETDSSFAPGSRISFSLALENLYPDLEVRIQYEGRIVRVEKHDGKTGVAVAIESQRIEAKEKAEFDPADGGGEQTSGAPGASSKN